MTLFTGPPFVITANSDTTLNASDGFISPSVGIVVAGGSFGGYALTLSSTFANDLYTLMGSPALYTGYTLYFSIGTGNNFLLVSGDSNIITDNSSTFVYNYGGVSGLFEPILFQVTQISPPQFTVWG